MKTQNAYKILMLLLLAVFAGACSDEEIEPLGFYNVVYEVPVHGTRYIGVKSGSGEYTLQVENPGLFSASEDKGWSTPEGMLLVRGLLTGESTLIVTDNRTGETASLAIKVIDNYEVLRVSTLYWDDSTSTIMENEHPVFSETPFVFLINNQSRDVYFADNKGENSLTSNGLRIQGKGNYSFTMENNKPFLTLTYPTDESGQLTDDVSAVATPHKFEITQSSEFLRHRLDENLNLGWETAAKDYPEDQRGLVMTMEEIDSDYKFESKLEQVEIPTGLLN